MALSSSTVMKRIYWYELPGNKYLKKLEPLMLTSEGCINKQEIRAIGQKRSEKREWIEVVYDRRYVVNRLLIGLLQPLNMQSLLRLLDLMIDVWLESQEMSPDRIAEATTTRLRLLGFQCVNLSKLKPRKLHGKLAYFADELESELNAQGFAVQRDELAHEQTAQIPC